MRYHHPVFQPLHFDYGTTTWSVNHMPLFGSILSVLDHRRLNVIHNITFFALMKVLTNGRITAKQSQAVFNLLDLSKNSNFWSNLNIIFKTLIYNFVPCIKPTLVTSTIPSWHS